MKVLFVQPIMYWVLSTVSKGFLLPEFKSWTVLLDDGKPCPVRKGMIFRRWKKQLENLGYKVEYRELRACDYGAPTIRKRLFVIARRDGLPIVWPEPTHGKGLKPYHTAAECIDWSIPCPSIFERVRPLAEGTMRRIAKGIYRYVINAKEPFIVGVGGRMGQSRPRAVSDPIQTITAKADSALVIPYVMTNTTGHSGAPIAEPVRTITTGGHHALIAAFLAQHNTERGNNVKAGRAASKPISTLTARGTQQQVVTSHLIKLYGTCQHGQDNRKPLPTVTANGNHIGEVRAFLVKYFETEKNLLDDQSVKVTVNGEDYVIADIGMRMLQPRELYRAQGFPDTYRIDTTVHDKPLSKTAQVRMCGNSVSPMVAMELVLANFQHKFENSYEIGAA